MGILWLNLPIPVTQQGQCHYWETNSQEPMAYRNSGFDTIFVPSALRLQKGEPCYSNVFYTVAEGARLLLVLSIGSRLPRRKLTRWH
jgi:hypothetical protein